MIKIKNLDGAVIHTVDAETLAMASLRGANLRGANLRGADLAWADLAGASLTGADLFRANLFRAILTGAILTGANLRGASLAGARLRNANITEADLAGAILSRADLTGAKLKGAILTVASLSGAKLDEIRADVKEILALARPEVPALLAAIRDGRVDGSMYEGECACLVGTLEKAGATGLPRREDRPAERFFTGISAGDTPATNPISAIVERWVMAFLEAGYGNT